MRLSRFIPRFSLRSLVLLSLLATSGVVLWRNWEPWPAPLFLNCGNESLSDYAFSPDAKWVATWSEYKVRLWNSSSGALQKTLEIGSTNQYCALDFSPDSKFLMTCSTRAGYCVARIWDVATGVKANVAHLDTTECPEIGFSFDGTQILDRTLTAKWDLKGAHRTLFFGTTTVRAASPSEEQISRIMAASNIEAFAECTKPFAVQSWFSQDRRVAATKAAGVPVIQIWDLTNGQKLQEIPSNEAGASTSYTRDNIVFSSDGGYFAGRYEHEIFDTEIRIWKIKHSNSVSKVVAVGDIKCISQSGLLVTNVSYGPTALCFWDATLGKQVLVSKLERAAIRQCTFFSDNSRLAVLKYQKSDFLEIVDSSTGRELANLSVPTSSANRNKDFLISADDEKILIPREDANGNGLELWQRRRPEWWWGIAWLPEFWLTLLFAGGFAWSVGRDWRELRKKKATPVSAENATL